MEGMNETKSHRFYDDHRNGRVAAPGLETARRKIHLMQMAPDSHFILFQSLLILLAARSPGALPLCAATRSGPQNDLISMKDNRFHSICMNNPYFK